MVKKIKNKNVKKERRTRADNQIKKDMYRINLIQKEVNDKMAQAYTESIYVMAATLRMDFGFGKQRIEKFMELYFKNVTDFSINNLWNCEDVEAMLVEECNLSMKKLLDELLERHKANIEKKQKEKVC